jgi:hypothetical protein
MYGKVNGRNIIIGGGLSLVDPLPGAYGCACFIYPCQPNKQYDDISFHVNIVCMER